MSSQTNMQPGSRQPKATGPHGTDLGLVPPIAEREFLSLAEAGRLLGVGRCRAWELANAGALPAIRLGRRWFVPRRALDALVEGAIQRSRERTE